MRRALDRPCRRDRRGQEGRGRQVAADFLENQRRLGGAQAQAAVALGDADAGEAELGELLPQAVTEAVLAAYVAPVAKLLRDRTLLGKEARRGFLKHLLVVGQ